MRYAPVFAWPPQPLAVAKWCLSYPGFLWPWNSIWLAITLITWFYFQPPTDAFVNIWSEAARSAALFMYARNLILLWLTAGGWHAVLYTLKLNGSHQKYYPEWQAHNNPKFMFSNQVYDNIFWSCVSGCTIWTAYEVWYFHLLAHGLVPALGWQSKPWTCAAWLCAIPFWRELHFYAVHRLIHWKPLYNTVHYLHHKNFNPGPWSGMAMHPVEHLFYFSVLLIHWFVPSHPIHFLFNAQHTALTPAGEAICMIRMFWLRCALQSASSTCTPTSINACTLLSLAHLHHHDHHHRHPAHLHLHRHRPAGGHHGFEGPILEGKVPTGSYFHYLHHRSVQLLGLL